MQSAGQPDDAACILTRFPRRASEYRPISAASRAAGKLDHALWLGLIGLLILLVACFNFTNLATARAMMRAREIGLRKCVGASRDQVAAQFLGEAVLMALVALVLALALVEMLLPAYDSFLRRPIALHYLRDWPLLLVIAVDRAWLRAWSAASIPRWCCRASAPPRRCAATSSGQAGSGRLRTALVVLQFAVSIGLGIATLVVFTQIDFARNHGSGLSPRQHRGHRHAAA